MHMYMYVSIYEHRSFIANVLTQIRWVNLAMSETRVCMSVPCRALCNLISIFRGTSCYLIV